MTNNEKEQNRKQRDKYAAVFSGLRCTEDRGFISWTAVGNQAYPISPLC